MDNFDLIDRLPLETQKEILLKLATKFNKEISVDLEYGIFPGLVTSRLYERLVYFSNYDNQPLSLKYVLRLNPMTFAKYQGVGKKLVDELKDLQARINHLKEKGELPVEVRWIDKTWSSHDIGDYDKVRDIDFYEKAIESFYKKIDRFHKQIKFIKKMHKKENKK